MSDPCETRQRKYFNNVVSQDHRFTKRLVKLEMGLFSSESAWQALKR